MGLGRLELEVGEPAGEGAQRHLALDAGERGAEAVVHAERERQVVVVGPPDVERVGVVEARRVAVGGGEERDDLLAGLEAVAAHLDVLQGDAAGHVHRSVVAEDLLDGVRRE
ncbi:MAG: hypothetical protein U5R31_03400 [Acidimicrobiia bacterium]|nr:hypothetical protein [Acidimicrobiia bacterium]